MNASTVIVDQLREVSFVKREALSFRIRRLHSFSPRFTRNVRVEYCRLSTTMTSLRSTPQALSSVGRLGPIRNARPRTFAGMHAISGVFGQNNLGTDAGKCEWLIRSLFKEE